MNFEELVASLTAAKSQTKCTLALMAVSLLDEALESARPDCWETLDAIADALVGGHFRLQQEPGEAGEDAAIRGVVRSIVTALADGFECETKVALAVGALQQALNEIGPQMIREAESEHG